MRRGSIVILLSQREASSWMKNPSAPKKMHGDFDFHRKVKYEEAGMTNKNHGLRTRHTKTEPEPSFLLHRCRYLIRNLSLENLAPQQSPPDGDSRMQLFLSTKHPITPKSELSSKSPLHREEQTCSQVKQEQMTVFPYDQWKREIWRRHKPPTDTGCCHGPKAEHAYSVNSAGENNLSLLLSLGQLLQGLWTKKRHSTEKRQLTNHLTC